MEDESCDLKWSITARTAPLGLHKKPNKPQILSTHQLLQPPRHVPGLTAGTPPRRPCATSRWPGVPGEQPQPPRSAQRAHIGEERSCFDMGLHGNGSAPGLSTAPTQAPLLEHEGINKTNNNKSKSAASAGTWISPQPTAASSLRKGWGISPVLLESQEARVNLSFSIGEAAQQHPAELLQKKCQQNSESES